MDKNPNRTLTGMDIHCNSPLQNRYLADLHTLSALLFRSMEEQGMHTTADLLKLSEEEVD